QAADRVIAPTRHFADLLADHGVTRPIRVVSNGVDDSLVDHRSGADYTHAESGPLQLIWCGRLSAEKRPLEAIEAVRRVPDCTLDVYGEGDQRDAAAAV
ncbi:glycosyltransferase, partial [Nocardia farcinica]